MIKTIMDFIVELVIADMIAEEMNEEQEIKKPVKKDKEIDTNSLYTSVKKKEIETPVVSLTDKNILVTFDEDDTEGITEFNDFAESMPCNMIKNENVFTIKADVEILYLCLYHLTTMYFGIVIC